MPVSLLLRPGSRYECHGDGTCCTNIHLLGPLTHRDAAKVRRASAQALPERQGAVIERHDGINALVLITENSKCVFLDPEEGCALHGKVGPESKSATCRHFPLGATWTPQGVRVTLSHRCACVTVGDSALLDEQRARAALESPGGRIPRARETNGKIRWRGRQSVTFQQYVDWETEMLEALDGASSKLEPIEDILSMAGPDRLPELQRKTWADLVHKLTHWVSKEALDDGFFCTLRWGKIALTRRVPATLPQRPWAWTFERAATRTPKPGSPRRIYGSWLADQLWAMAWLSNGTVYRGLMDMAARYALAQRIAPMLESMGARKDIAAAEAVMIIDTLGASDPWEWIGKRFREPPVGTFEIDGG